jgi:hypothetical protein
VIFHGRNAVDFSEQIEYYNLSSGCALAARRRRPDFLPGFYKIKNRFGRAQAA